MSQLTLSETRLDTQPSDIDIMSDIRKKNKPHNKGQVIVIKTAQHYESEEKLSSRKLISEEYIHWLTESLISL